MKTENRRPDRQGEVTLRVVLIAPPPGVDFGVQEGKGTGYTTIQKRRSQGGDLSFEFTVTVKDNREDGLPNFLGPRTHGPTTGRFLYINIGQSAGQSDTPWDRRLKIPLDGITWDLLAKQTATMVLEAQLPGTGKDGGPSCATVKPTQGWKVRPR